LTLRSNKVLTYLVTLAGRRVEWRSFTSPHTGSPYHYYVVACSPSIWRRNSRPELVSPTSPCRHADRLVLAWSIIFRRLACPSVRIGCKICRVSTTRFNLFSISTLSVFQATSAWSNGEYSASTPLTMVFSRLQCQLASRNPRWSSVTYESLSPAPTPLSTSMLSSFSVSTMSVNTGLITSHIASNRSRSSRLETTSPRHLMACGRYVTFCRLASLKITCCHLCQQICLGYLISTSELRYSAKRGTTCGSRACRRVTSLTLTNVFALASSADQMCLVFSTNLANA
jgi:hypothetical protein